MMSLKTAVASLFKITKQIRSLEFTLTSNLDEESSLLQRRRRLDSMELKSALLEVALTQVRFIKNNLSNCIYLNVSQIDLILKLVSICDALAIEHLRATTDLECLYAN